jgi:hypothetical protein
MTTTQRTRPAFPEYLPHIRPFGSPWTTTYDAIVAGPMTTEAMALDRALRGLVTHMPGRIHAILALRDLLAVGGIRLGLREAKETVDAMIARIASERA